MLAVLLAASLLVAQPEEFHAVCGFEPGTRYELRVHQYVESDGTVLRDSHARVILEIEERTDGPLILIFTMDLGDQQLSLAQIRFLGLAQKDLRSTAEFVLDDQFYITGVRNWEQLRDKGNNLAEKIMEARVKAGLIESSHADQRFEALTNMTSTEAGVRSIYSKRLSPYLLGYDWRLSEGEPIVQEVSLSNPYGGAPLPATITTELDDDPDTPDLVEYKFTQSLDPERAAAMIGEFLTRGGVPDDEQLQQALQDMQISDAANWAYDPATQLIKNARFERQMQLPGQALSIERWTWDLVTISTDGP